MRKIPSVFKRDYEGSHQVISEVVEGCEWVLAGEGRPTMKWDGTCCLVRGGKLWKRYDRKITKAGRKRAMGEVGGPLGSYVPADFRPSPEGWVKAEEAPNLHTGHWPGWIPVGNGPEDGHHRAAWARWGGLADGTYELVGPKINANRHGLDLLHLMPHGDKPVRGLSGSLTFQSIRERVERIRHAEGIVWHHQDGRMAKIKRKDFGFSWPVG